MKPTRAAVIVSLALSLAPWPTARSDVLEPFDGIAGEPGSGALALFPAVWDYPVYVDQQLGDVDVNGRITGAALKGGYFFPKIADRFSWGTIFSIPYFEIETNGSETQSGFADPGLGLAFWPYESAEKNLYLSLWWVSYFPVGKYDENNPVTSPGSDAFTHVPAFEVGWYPGSFLFDGLVQYWYFDESDKLRIDIEDYVELDLVFSYMVTEKFIPSVHATARWETEDLAVGGMRVPDTRGHVYSLGPKVSYFLQENIMLSLTWLHDVDAQNRLKGDWIYGRIAWGFGP